MGSGLHVSTALIVSALWLTGIVVWVVRRRQRSAGLVTESVRATYETLHTASLAAVEFRDGLTEQAAARAGRHLRSMLGSVAVAVCDQAGLLDWLGGFHTPPRHTCVIHGEASASATFAQAIRDRLGWQDVMLPKPGDSLSL